ncbi:ATP-binding cassette domain-containing protein [Methylobacterium brachiatum]|uniref:ATP-binding cassette domain-containing protein n=1 Tax=Methylobacterium brachiatum TaxID=269660 RepID=UPI0024484C18|nr:ATP-binding cassette domain-containing protein [Methylobacterium brachiatum]MDH2314137.1 ATP-binding cassette domain-containing protein [Methylobacterium brachiatum]
MRDVEVEGCRFDFAVESGEILAVAADEGIERTVAALLARRVRPQRGWVMVGGADIAAFNPEKLRSEILVLDRSTLAETTIREYLSLVEGQDPATIHDCLERVGLVERIRRLPYGLDTPLSASGSPLSAGEAVALKLAATLLQPPKLVVLSTLFDLLPPDRVAAALARFREAGTTVLHVTRRPPQPIYDDQIRLGLHGYVRATEREDRLDNAKLRERTHAVAA